ncbi:hypothetical protein ALMP_35880 [Streptomyces sp. A012304]|nr:hypothetical protein ALMP_35880 [Streptomyces sp. A012304]
MADRTPFSGGAQRLGLRPVKTSDSNTGFLIRSYSAPVVRCPVPGRRQIAAFDPIAAHGAGGQQGVEFVGGGAVDRAGGLAQDVAGVKLLHIF